MLTVEALERFPDALAHWQHTFRYILVDEYQDTNHAQYRLLQLLAAEHGNVFAVGDPDQIGLRLPRRRHQQHPRLRARLPGRALDRARAELPLHELDPRRRQRRDREQPRPQAEAALLGARRGRAGAGRRGRGRAHRGALRRSRDRAARRRRLVGVRDRGLLPHERPEPRARGRARAAADPVPGDRRPAFLRARRDQGRDRLPLGARQPGRRRLADADREPPAPRDRRHVAAAARHPRGGARADAVRGDGRSGGGRVSARRRSRPCADSTP